MAKSTGNLVLVSELLKEHSAAAVRLLILDRRWDQDWDFSPAALDAAAARLERLQAAAGRPDHGIAGSGAGGIGAGGSGAAAVAATRAALASDLDVPAALRIAESEGGQAARSLGGAGLVVAGLALWWRGWPCGGGARPVVAPLYTRPGRLRPRE
jgi:cysteinyl-tRNA synthetase